MGTLMPTYYQAYLLHRKILMRKYLAAIVCSPPYFFFGGACPKNAPSGASTPSRVAQKADRALNCGLFGQPGGLVNYKFINSLIRLI